LPEVIGQQHLALPLSLTPNHLSGILDLSCQNRRTGKKVGFKDFDERNSSFDAQLFRSGENGKRRLPLSIKFGEVCQCFT
jgi:hypothetical protein